MFQTGKNHGFHIKGYSLPGDGIAPIRIDDGFVRSTTSTVPAQYQSHQHHKVHNIAYNFTFEKILTLIYIYAHTHKYYIYIYYICMYIMCIYIYVFQWWFSITQCKKSHGKAAFGTNALTFMGHLGDAPGVAHRVRVMVQNASYTSVITPFIECIIP